MPAILRCRTSITAAPRSTGCVSAVAKSNAGLSSILYAVKREKEFRPEFFFRGWGSIKISGLKSCSYRRENRAQVCTRFARHVQKRRDGAFGETA